MDDIRNDKDIKKLVYVFYDKVEQDKRLGYIFNDIAGIEWETHLPKMVDFWSNILFRTGRYRGKPFRKHMPLPIQRSDFDIWYGLWTETVDELFKGERADQAKEMAAKIASSFIIRMEMEGKFNR
ncbi:MAG: group III truncated hemoglobin [Balneolaceae bacterium]|nr:group III truncated hemoglobin [Balneolaceae bacterium]